MLLTVPLSIFDSSEIKLIRYRDFLLRVSNLIVTDAMRYILKIE